MTVIFLKNLTSQSMIKIRHITVFNRMNEITKKTVFKKIEIDKLINNFSLPNYQNRTRS